MEVPLANCNCFTCGAVFQCTSAFISARAMDNGIFYCPNGHQMNFLKGKGSKDIAADNTRMEKEIEELKRYSISLLSRIDQLEARESARNESM